MLLHNVCMGHLCKGNGSHSEGSDESYKRGYRTGHTVLVLELQELQEVDKIYQSFHNMHLGIPQMLQVSEKTKNLHDNIYIK